MSIDFKNETLTLSELKWNQSASLLVEGDMIVPDIKPDIREILLTEATPVLTHQEIAGNKLNITGTVNIHILYLPDIDGALPKAIETKFNFKDSLELSSGDLADVCVKVSTQHIEFSLINSRKMNIKIIVSLKGRGYGKKECRLLTDLESQSPLKIKKKHISAYHIVTDAQQDIVISEILELPAGKPEIDDIIKLNAKAVKGDCKIVSGKILLKGGLIVNTLYCTHDADDGVQHAEHELVFSEMVDIEGLNEDCMCNVTYNVKNVYYSVKEDTNGEDRLLALDVVLQAEIMASRTQETDIIDDCYSTIGKALLKTESIKLDELLAEGISHENIKEILTVPEDVPVAGAVYSLQCTPRITEMKIADEKMIISGKLTAFVLYGCIDADNPLYSMVGEFDFEHIVPVDGLDDTALCEYSVTEQGVSFTLNAASEIELRCVLEFYVRALAKRETHLLTGCELIEEETVAPHHSMVIYFAQPNDSLWDIAKHYKTDQEKIMALNKLEHPTLIAGQKILIPGPSHS